MGLGSTDQRKRSSCGGGGTGHPGTFPSEREVRVAGDMPLCRERSNQRKGFSGAQKPERDGGENSAPSDDAESGIDDVCRNSGTDALAGAWGDNSLKIDQVIPVPSILHIACVMIASLRTDNTASTDATPVARRSTHQPSPDSKQTECHGLPRPRLPSLERPVTTTQFSP